MKKIVITGCAGFLGRNLIEFLSKDYEIIGIDKFGEISHPIEEIQPFCKEVHNMDLSHGYTLTPLINVLKTHSPALLVHLAAISHVDDSIQAPTFTVLNNVMAGTNALEACKQTGTSVLSVSTDEVIGSFPVGTFGALDAKLNPASPYSSSKAAVDLIAESYKTTFNLDVTTIRMSNLYGPHQHVQKMIPKTISALLKGEPIHLYGKGTQIRNWLYISDACNYFKHVIDELITSSYRRFPVYHFDGDNEINNFDLIFKIAELMNLRPTIQFVADRLGHDFRYALQPNLGVVGMLMNQRVLPDPVVGLEDGLKLTIAHYEGKSNNEA